MSPSPAPNSFPQNEATTVDGGLSAVKRDAGSGGSIPVSGPENSGARKKSPLSFASVVSSSSSNYSKSPLSTPSTPPITQSWQKHTSPSPRSSCGPSPLRNHNKNTFVNNISLNIGNEFANGTSTQSTSVPGSSAASLPYSLHNNLDGDQAHDSIGNGFENDQEDRKSSDVETYLKTLNFHNSTSRMLVLSDSTSAHSPTSNTSANKTQSPISNHPHAPSHSQFDLQPPPSTTIESGQIPFFIATTNQFDSHDSAQPQIRPEQCVVEPLRTYGDNGHNLALPYGLGVSASPFIPNDEAKKSLSPPAFGSAGIQKQSPHHQQEQHQNNFVAAVTTSFSDASRNHTPVQTARSSSTRHSTLYRAENGVPANPLINNDSLPGSGPLAPTTLSLTAENAGPPQMGMSTSGLTGGEFASPAPFAHLNAGFSTSASESGLNGVGVIGKVDLATTNGNDNVNFSTTGFDAVKIPNVYINGLPPHFSEDELFNLCCEFGPIVRVGTFTRHNGDSESGYGFVLFENVEDAERCIVTLEKFTNLHPAFAKQIHKIPGTNYSGGPSLWNGSSINDDSASGNASFKAKMEILHDPTNTNLYMEGLPLSINEATLWALVAPHKVLSRRFFRTKLSNPPRIIAFVRLDTRAGAEEVIERLHGLMLRGWNDPGSRISVRFADTGEQRELRRAERAAQNGDSSPSRLTIAQASLLNLRGQELRPSQSSSSLQVHQNVGLVSSDSSIRGFSTSVSAPDFSSNAVYGDLGHSHSNLTLPVIGGGRRSALDVDYSLVPGGAMNARSRSRSPYGPEYHHLQIDGQYGVARHSPHSFGQFGLGQRSSPMDPSMTTFGTRGIPPRGAAGYVSQLGAGVEADLYAQNGGMRLHQYQFQEGLYGQQPQHHLPVSQSVDSLVGQQYIRPSPAYTRSGYTPAEEYIMRSHTEGSLLAQPQRHQPGTDAVQYPQHVDRYRPAPLDLNRQRTANADDAANIGVGIRAYRAQASLMSPNVMSASDSTGSISNFGGVGMLRMEGGAFGMQVNGNGTAEDYHSTALTASRLSLERGPYPSSQRSMGLSPFLGSSSSSLHQNQDGSSPSLVGASSVTSPEPNETVISAYPQHAAAAHMRSTTLPQHRQSTGVVVHAKHSSMSMPKQNLATPQHASVARLGGNSGMAEGSSETIYESEGQEMDGKQAEYVGVTSNSAASSATASGTKLASMKAGNSMPLKAHYSSSTIFGDVDQTLSSSPLSPSFSLISPTLTYGSQSPSTLSPATPFFGSFSSSAEGFEKSGGGEQQMQPGQKRGLVGGCVVGSGLKSGNR